MKLVKNAENPDLFNLEQLEPESLIAEYNIALNYKAYVDQLLGLPPARLSEYVPGLEYKDARNNLISQRKFCEDFIELWNAIINQDKQTKQN
jgi:hypothetical protein